MVLKIIIKQKSVKNKKKQTSLKRFGTENPRQLEQVKQRYKKYL